MVGLSDGEVPLIPSGVGVLPKEKKTGEWSGLLGRLSKTLLSQSFFRSTTIIVVSCFWFDFSACFDLDMNLPSTN